MRPSPFDCAGRSCENTAVKLYTLVLLIAVAACGKANDLPAMKEEAGGLVKRYHEHLELLAKRASGIEQRGNAVGVTTPEARNASQIYARAKAKLEQLRATVRNAPTEIAAIKEPVEMRRWFDRTEKQLVDGSIEINADFSAIESWLTVHERRKNQVSGRANAPVTPIVPPPTGTANQMGAGGTTPAE